MITDLDFLELEQSLVNKNYTKHQDNYYFDFKRYTIEVYFEEFTGHFFRGYNHEIMYKFISDDYRFTSKFEIKNMKLSIEQVEKISKDYYNNLIENYNQI